MRQPKTVRGLFSLLQKIEQLDISGVDGFDDLPDGMKSDLYELSAALSNRINAILDGSGFLKN